jgi:hypothetical protein
VTEDAMVEPKSGGLVACRDDCDEADAAWMRAKIEEVLPDDKIKVFFLDYGHRAVVSPSSLRNLSETLVSMTPQALDCTLAVVKV